MSTQPPKHQTKTAAQLAPGDLAMILDERYPDAYHRVVLDRRQVRGVVLITWRDPGELEERPTVHYGAQAEFDVARDRRCVRRK